MFSKRGLVFTILLVCALGAMLYAWNLGRPVALADAPGDRLSCVSYAPFHRPGQTPFDKALQIGEAQIEADLATLARRFGCVRIYSVMQGLQVVPRLAQKLGIQVLLGAWIGSTAAENDREIAQAIELARQYPATIRAVIVGNEVLLRKELPVAKLREYLVQIRAALPGVPVSYADAWEFWLLYQRDLLDVVSFATVHIIPYWENDPMAVADAVEHVSAIYRQVKTALGGKPVMVGETGWPGYGRQRQDAIPSQVNQARFIREFAQRMEQEQIPYSVIEAFDQPWKLRTEGAVGGSWGLYDAGGAVKFPFRGPVAESLTWSRAAYLAMLGCCGGLVALRWRQGRPGAAAGLALLAVGCSGGALLAAVGRDMAMANRTPLAWIYTGGYAALLVLAMGLLGIVLADWCADGKPPPQPAALGGLSRAEGQAARWLGGLRFAFLFGAAAVCLLLMFDPGSRDFPLALYALSAVGFALLAWIGGGAAGLEEILLAGWLVVGGLWIAVAEHLTFPQGEPGRLADAVNLHALGWTALCLVFGGAVLIPAALGARQRQKA